MSKILIVDDEVEIAQLISDALEDEGFETALAFDGESAYSYILANKSDISLITLDIMMPGMDGITLCKELRNRTEKMGIIMLTAKSQEIDKISGLMTGADDYITKPFSPAELLARVDALYRRVEIHVDKPKPAVSEIKLGIFTLDLRKRTLTKKGKNVELTQVEYQMVEYFFNHPELTIGRSDILAKVWGDSYVGEEKIVDVNIRRLRKKIEEDASDPKYLITVWGLGYKWTANY